MPMLNSELQSMNMKGRRKVGEIVISVNILQLKSQFGEYINSFRKCLDY